MLYRNKRYRKLALIQKRVNTIFNFIVAHPESKVNTRTHENSNKRLSRSINLRLSDSFEENAARNIK